MIIFKIFLLWILIGAVLFLSIYKVFKEYATETIEKDHRLRWDPKIRKVWFATMVIGLIIFWPAIAKAAIIRILYKLMGGKK